MSLDQAQNGQTKFFVTLSEHQGHLLLRLKDGTADQKWASKALLDVSIAAVVPIAYLEYHSCRCELAGKSDSQSAAALDVTLDSLRAFFADVSLPWGSIVSEYL